VLVELEADPGCHSLYVICQAEFAAEFLKLRLDPEPHGEIVLVLVEEFFRVLAS